MSSTVVVEVSYTKYAPSGSPVIDLAAPSMLTDPPGEAGDIVARFASGLNAMQKLAIGSNYLRMRDAGAFAGLSGFGIMGSVSADFFMNWLNPSQPAINNGAVFTPGAGLATDGVSQWISLNMPTTGNKFTLNSACAGVYVTGTPAFASNAPLLTHGGSGSNALRIYPQTSTGQPVFRVNTTASASAATRVRADCGGFWHVDRPDANTQRLWHDGNKIGEAAVAAAVIAPNLGIGNVGGTFSPAISNVAAWWYGQSLTDAQREALRAGIEGILSAM